MGSGRITDGPPRQLQDCNRGRRSQNRHRLRVGLVIRPDPCGTLRHSWPSPLRASGPHREHSMVLHFLPLVLAMSGQAPPQQAPPPPPQQSVPAATVAPRQPQAPRKIYSETADAKALIATAIAGAEESDIRVLINWGANDDERSTEVHAVATVAGNRDAEVLLGRVQARLRGRRPPRQEHGRGRRRTARSLLPAPCPTSPSSTPTARSWRTRQRRRWRATTRRRSIRRSSPRSSPNTRRRRPTPTRHSRAALSQAKKDGKYVFLWFSAPW